MNYAKLKNGLRIILLYLPNQFIRHNRIFDRVVANKYYFIFNLSTNLIVELTEIA